MLAVKSVPQQKKIFKHWTDLCFSYHKHKRFIGVSTNYKKLFSMAAMTLIN